MKFKVKDGPYIKSNNSTSKMMKNLFIALLPIILFSFYKNGIVPYLDKKTDFLGMIYPLIFIFIASATCKLIEVFYARFILKKKNEELKNYNKNSYAIFPGLFLGLILPLNTPILILIFGCFMATIVGKMLYGGFGQNIFNPALIGRIFIISTYAAVISKNGGYLNPSEMDAITSATPLTNAKLVDGIGNYATLIAPYGRIRDFFFGMIPGAIGETSSFLVIIGFIYLLLQRVIKWKIPVFYIGTVFLMTYVIGSLNGLGAWYAFYQIFSGGLMFGAIFMATDPVTSPTTSVGSILYGISLGILTVIFRFLTPLPEGVLTSILTMNMFTIILDKIGSINTEAIKKICIPLVILIVIGSFVTINISNSYKNNSGDSKFEIIDKTKDDNKIKYIASYIGNHGPIECEIEIENNKIINYKILKQDETEMYFKMVLDDNYLDKLKNSNDLTNIDTVSGATISSNALKQLFINVMKDYNGDNNGKN